MANPLSRRSFLAAGVAIVNGLVGLLMAVPAIGYLLTPLMRKGQTSWVRVGEIGAFGNDQPHPIQYRFQNDAEFLDTVQRKTAFVIHDQDQWRVLSATCTHMGCTVAYHPDTDSFDCPCHGGRYDSQGNVIAGPPPRSLLRLNSRVVDENLEIEVS